MVNSVSFIKLLLLFMKNRFPTIHLPALFATVLLLSACSNQRLAETPVELPTESAQKAVTESSYCDNYFVYQMCAQDINEDGQVDYMYFNDSKEIFMQSAELAARSARTPWEQLNIEAASGMHRCVQTMDNELQQAASALLTINEDTGAFTKTKIKTRLMLSYGRYMGDINRCHYSDDDMAIDEQNPQEDSYADAEFDSEIIDGQEFGDYDFADF